jgi:transposase
MKTELLIGPERRRRWSAGEKASIVAEAAMAGVTVAEISRRHGISRSLLYSWRREACDEAGMNLIPRMVPAIIDDQSGRDLAPVPAIRRAARSGGMRQRNGVIEIALAGEVLVTVRGVVDAKGLRAILAVLRR